VQETTNHSVILLRVTISNAVNQAGRGKCGCAENQNYATSSTIQKR